jgi:7-cyano-7-deazaguanine synthase
MPSSQATVLLSGGIDSAACAYLLKSQGLSVEGLFFDYGQSAARREQEASVAIAKFIEIPISTVTVSGPAKHGSGEVTGRNAFLVFGALVVKPFCAGVLAIGIHAGTDYYDCSAAFLSSMSTLMAEHTNGLVSLIAPFREWSKKQVYDYFREAKLPIDLTYSCESGTDIPCSRCNSCRDRRVLGC